MKLIKPYYKIRTKIDASFMLKDIEDAGRTCYKSEDKITDESAPKFVEMISKRNHESVLEHQFISVLFVCDRGVSHELVRHRLSSFSQESTRYCSYSKNKFDNQITFIIPEWLDIPEHSCLNKDCIELVNNLQFKTWMYSMFNAELDYMKLSELGWKPEQARSVLPNSLKTEIVMTANLRQWRTIFKQRTAAAAHPQMRQLMRPLLDELKTKLPIVFDDITY
jgi:thymidylate synthase (FAD)